MMKWQGLITALAATPVLGLSDAGLIRRLDRLKSKHDPIPLKGSLFKDIFVDTGDSRPFEGLVLLTSTSEQCAPCRIIEERFQFVAEKMASVYAPKHTHNSKPVYLFKADYATLPTDLFRSLDIDYLPIIMNVNDNTLQCDALDHCTAKSEHLKIDPAEFVTAAGPKKTLKAIGAEKILSSYKKKYQKQTIPDAEGGTGKKKGQRPVDLKKRFASAAMILGPIGFFAIWNLDKTRNLLLRFPIIIALGALVVFWISTAGVVYSWEDINRGEWFPHDMRAGSFSLFNPKHRTQYAGEGLLFSALNILFGLVFMFALCLPSMTRGVLGKGKHRALSTILVSVSQVALLLIALWILYNVKATILVKEPYISGQFWPDSSFTKGGPRNDRGYAPLPEA